MIRKILCSIWLILLLVPSILTAQSTAIGANGMVASVDAYATKIGVEILEKGGNAVDAAIAVHMALAVTHPQAGNIGGGGFFIIYLEGDKLSTTIDFREKAPLAGHRDMYLDDDGNVIENSSVIGYKAAGVPGSVAGLWYAHKKYGSLPWKDLLEPARKLAAEGITVNYWLGRSLKSALPVFNRFPSTKEIFTKNGKAYQFGDLLVQTDLAWTIEQIINNGRDGFYQGEVAQRIVADMKANGGLITLEDLKIYQPVERKPVEGTYREYSFISMPPPSSGGVLLKQMLKMLEPYDLNELGHNSSSYIQLITEVEKLAYADRAEYLGDPDFYQVPSEHITSDKYIDNRRKLINLEIATPSTEISNGPPPARESEETTHFSVVDKWGNAVSCTTTLNSGFGSCVVAKGTGVILNNEMDDFSIKPGFPNIYGLVGGEANAIAPGKRMLSSMTPTIILKNDKVYLVVGSPGGSTIITTVLQVVLNVLDHSLALQKAVAFPRFHHQWLPDITFVEDTGFSKDVLSALSQKGHNLKPRSALGDVHAILVDAVNGLLFGVSDPRRGGLAKGF